MLKPLLIILVAVTAPVCAWASGGHYPVDDALIVEPGHFQLETWFSRKDGDGQEFAFMPAWTPFGTRIELTAGYARIEETGERFNRFNPALKWQYAPVDPGRFGAAVAVQGTWEDTDSRWTDWLINFPSTYTFRDLPVLVHLNLGYLRRRGEDWNDRLFFGSGFEWQPTDLLAVIGQAYREGADQEPETQLGLRFTLGGAIDHLDLALGQRLRGDKDSFVTAGVAVTF